MPQKKDRIITVDGVGYSLDTGRSVSTTPKTSDSHSDVASDQVKAVNTLDLRHFSPEPVASPTVRRNQNTETGVKTQIDLRDKPPRARQETSELDVSQERANSHPANQALESTRAGHRKVQSDYFKKVFVLPFTQRVDRYVVQGILLSTMISPYFWFLALTPGLVVKLINTQRYTLTDLLTLVRNGFVPVNYYPFVIILGAFLALSLVSLLVSYLVLVVARATKLRAIDHRSVSPRLLYRQAANKSLRSLGNWLLNTVVVCLVFTVSTWLVWWLIVSHQPIISSSLSAILPIVIITLALILIIFMMRWPISQTMIAATDKSTWFIQVHSLRLAFGSGGKNILSAAMLTLMSLVTWSIIALIGWAEVAYLVSSPYLYMQVGLFVLGAILILIILVCYRIWKNMFLASHYHILASIRGKVAMSNYLSLERPAKISLVPFIITASIVGVVLVGYVVAGYIYQDNVTAAMKKVHDRVPATLEIRIPKPTK